VGGMRGSVRFRWATAGYPFARWKVNGTEA
jgi:hypothetical protein